MPVTLNAAPGPRRHAYPMRPRRRRLVRLGLVAAALGVGALVAVPALEWATHPAPLSVPPAHAAAEEPSPTATAAPAAIVPSSSPSPSPSPLPPVANRGPVGTTARADVVNGGVPPSRLAGEPGDPTAPNPSVLTGYDVWPLAHPRLTLPFGPTGWGEWIVDGQPFHDGIDIATFCGDRVRATHDGVVLAAGRHFDDLIGWVGDLGPYYHRLDAKHAWSILPNVVIVDDGNGYRSIYAHFSRMVVRVGQHVRAGQLLGYEGMTGHASGCHVHYGIFSPLETGLFRMNPGTVRRMKVPTFEIARIDPRSVLPPMPKPAKAPASEPPPTGG